MHLTRLFSSVAVGFWSFGYISRFLVHATLIIVALVARLAHAHGVCRLVGVGASRHRQSSSVLTIARRAHALRIMLSRSVRAVGDFLSVLPHGNHNILLLVFDRRLILGDRLGSSRNVGDGCCCNGLFFVLVVGERGAHILLPRGVHLHRQVEVTVVNNRRIGILVDIYLVFEAFRLDFDGAHPVDRIFQGEL